MVGVVLKFIGLVIFRLKLLELVGELSKLFDKEGGAVEILISGIEVRILVFFLLNMRGLSPKGFDCTIYLNSITDLRGFCSF